AGQALAGARRGHSCGGGAGATMRRLHLVVGLVGLLAFLASGQYMDLGYDHLRRLDDTRRMLFRSTHIYLLFAALLNLALGLYLVRFGVHVRDDNRERTPPLVRLKAHCGPGDQGEPVITVLLPEED